MSNTTTRSFKRKMEVLDPPEATISTTETPTTGSDVPSHVELTQEEMEVDGTNQPDNKPEQNQNRKPSEMEFEEMFFNESTQKSAWEMMTGKRDTMKSKLTESFYRLRSSDALATAVDKVGVVVPGSSDLNNTKPEFEQGAAMVNELLNRYEKNKREELRRDKTEKPKNADPLLDDLSDEDERFLLDFSKKDSTSDFLKFTVPQYELKDKLWNLHKTTIADMSREEIGKICDQIVPELKSIMNGDTYSERHEEFEKVGLDKKDLRMMTVTEPFTQVQELKIMDIIRNTVLADVDPDQFDHKLFHYTTLVLVPEALIRIFAIANKIPIELSEKELRYGPKYGGNLPEDIISTIPPQPTSGQETQDFKTEVNQSSSTRTRR